jgi:predicted PurR-regulated permease PerM
MATSAEAHALPLRRAAAVIALAIGMIAVAALLYALVDVLIAFFLGIVVAAALQPWHRRLGELGVPRGAAVLLIYLLILTGLLLVGVLVGPVLVEQITEFVATLPARYAELRDGLAESPEPLFQALGRQLPEFAELQSVAASVALSFFRGVFGFTTGLVGFLGYFVTVLAVGFYWTLEVPRVERLLLSLTPVDRRGQVLDAWHEIEGKLGAFIRGQALAMLAVGIASGIGYFLIGLPNSFTLAVLAGLLEAVPLIGPTLAAVPALAVAGPLGLTPVLLVLGWTVLVQVVENNVLIPRIMGRTVGMSPLLGIFAVLAFSLLYGLVGMLVAIPLTAVAQVLFDRLLLKEEPPAEEISLANAAPPPTSRLGEVGAQARLLRQQARERLRSRETRVGEDAAEADRVADAVDQEIERAVDRVEAALRATEEELGRDAPRANGAIAEALEEATLRIEAAARPLERPADGTGSLPEGTSADLATVDESESGDGAGASGGPERQDGEEAMAELQRAAGALDRAEALLRRTAREAQTREAQVSRGGHGRARPTRGEENA